MHIEHVPPQSTSLSVPSRTPSVHVAAHFINVHRPPRQSPFIAQPCWKPHFVVHGPPQSTSVSVPFFTPSVHVGFEQTLALQMPSTQSRDPTAHPLPSAHLAHVPPPQSVSVSMPFL